MNEVTLENDNSVRTDLSLLVWLNGRYQRTSGLCDMDPMKHVIGPEPSLSRSCRTVFAFARKHVKRSSKCCFISLVVL